MKLATYNASGSDRLGVVRGERIYDLLRCTLARNEGDSGTYRDMRSLLVAGESAIADARALLDWAQAQPDQEDLTCSLDEVKLRPPLLRPGKLLCLAGNYADHILEGGGSYPGKDKMIPRFFIKPGTAVIGPHEPIRIPSSSAWTDWELELAVVIGKAGRDIEASKARDHIVGYTILNDVSARELAFREDRPQQNGDEFFDWLVGKWLDTYAPMGPWLTTADEIADPDRLDMKLWLNDELQQDGNTGQMIFTPAEAIAFISQFITLEPGDVISTGTPAGVGYSKDVSLKAGDRIRCAIDGLGVLENDVQEM